MDFKTPKELLDFVLKKCGNMTYAFATIDDERTKLDISGPFDIKRIYYASQLLKDDFNITVTELRFSEDNTEELCKDNYLEMMDINFLALVRGKDLTIPKLPKTINKLTSGTYGEKIEFIVSEWYRDGDEHDTREYIPCGFDFSSNDFKIWLYDTETEFYCIYYVSDNGCLVIDDHSDRDELYFANIDEFNKYIDIHRNFLSDELIEKFKKNLYNCIYEI